jgi:hypothetical protein
MRLTTAALTMTAALAFTGLAMADEQPGNWFTRMFTPTLERPKKEELKVDPAKAPAITTSNNNSNTNAKADWLRRQEVCDKLRDLAIAIGDEDLRRKAELLDQRAYDLYLAVKNQASAAERPVAANPDAKKGGR